MKKLITSLLFFFNITPVFSSQIPDKNSLLFLDNFGFGLYTNAIGNKLPKNAAKVLRNFLIDEKNGSLVRPNGFTVLGSTTGLSKINFILPFIKSDNTVEFLVTDNSSLLTTVDFIIYKPVKLGLSGTSDLVGIQYKTKTWWTNGINSVFTYDGSTVAVMDGNTYATLQTPNIPKGKCIESDLKSIWIGNIPTDNSLVAWSAIFSTAGDRVDPDNYLAWPTANQTTVGLGDGQQITFLKTFGGTLIAGKERSIYSRYGDSDTNFIFIKTKSKIGYLSQFSVVEHENLLFGQAYDGFYAFDGQNVESISDYIKPDFNTIRADTTKNVTNTWETQSNFSRGYFSGTTSTLAGFLTVIYSSSILVSTVPSQVSLLSVSHVYTAFHLNTSTSTGFFSITTNTIDSSRLLRISTHSFPSYLTATAGLSFMTTTPNSGAKPSNNCKVTIRNMRTGATAYAETPSTVDTGDNFINIDITFVESSGINNLLFTGDDIINGNLQMRIEQPDGCSAGSPNCELDIAFSSYAGNIILENAPLGQFISDVATNTSLTNWGTFDSIYTQNSGNVSFYFRTSTTASSISTAPWTSITPGSVINSSPSFSYVQWASTIVSPLYTTTIDNVTISHNEGNSSITRSFGIDYLGRLWIGVSTESTGNFPLIYVKVRKTNTQNPIGWSQLEGIPIRYMLKYQNYIYAGHSSTGSVLRLDYGTNYGGQPITSVYESPDMALENSYNQLGVSYKDIYGFTFKDLWEYIIDATSNNSANLRIGTALDGRSFNYNTVALTDPNNTITSVRNPNGGNATWGKLVRIRFDNSEIDKQLIVNNFGIIYIPTKSR